MDSELSELEGMEEMDGNAWMKELASGFEKLPPEERAYRVIRSFFKTEQTDKEIATSFFIWLCSEHNAEEKEQALKRVFDEISPERTDPSARSGAIKKQHAEPKK